MSTILASPTLSLSEFKNESAADFSRPEHHAAMQQALSEVRAQLGREYDLLIAGERIKTGDLLKSANPSRPAEVIGVHHRATPELARRAVESAHQYFPVWASTPARARVEMLVRAADIIRPGNSSSTPGWCTRRARPGPKRKRMCARRSISASTTRARC